MNTKRILVSVVTGAALIGSLAMAAPGNDPPRGNTKAKTTAKASAATTVSGGRHHAVANQRVMTSSNVRTSMRANRAVRNDRVVTSGNPRGTTGAPVQTRNRVVTRNYSYPSGYRSYGYGYGYPYYSYGYGPSVSFGFGYPYYGYYPYDYYSYPYSYNYGSYYYNDYGHGHGSIVIAVQSRLARMGYYRGPVDGIMGPGTSFAIRAYERDHGLRVDGAISRQLVRNMGLRY
jgi:hypothetical protein